VDVVLPVIGRRKATHKFRLGIESGTLDFAQLESGLAGLENAFIDFAVRGGALVLERDIPLIPGDSKPILIWPLDEPGEPELAARKRVRLRRLARFTVPGQSAAKPTKSAVVLHSLALGELDVELTMSAAQAAASPDAASQVLDGWVRHAELATLRATGGIRHEPAADPHAGALELAATALAIELADVSAGTATLAHAHLRVAAIDSARLVFSGLRPTSIEATTSGWEITDVAIELSPAAD
jgi:hypothetical protein